MSIAAERTFRKAASACSSARKRNCDISSAALERLEPADYVRAPPERNRHMDIQPDAIAAIGNTPLIRLRRASEQTGCEILGKAEFMNPGQSVKDRAALYIIRDAVEKG